MWTEKGKGFLNDLQCTVQNLGLMGATTEGLGLESNLIAKDLLHTHEALGSFSAMHPQSQGDGCIICLPVIKLSKDLCVNKLQKQKSNFCSPG